MVLRDKMVRAGRWLFRWRAYTYVVLFLCAAWEVLVAFPTGWNSADRRPWGLAGLAVALAGVAWRVYTAGHVAPGTSGRSTREPRGEALNTTGAYSIVRNPLYLGNYLIVLGCAIPLASLGAVVVVSAAYWIAHVPIVAAEDDYLRHRFDPGFEAWARKTPAFLPDPRLWQRPALPFSLRVALRREYRSVPAVVTWLALVDTAMRASGEHRLHVDPLWLTLFLCGLAFFLVVRVSLKTTAVLARR